MLNLELQRAIETILKASKSERLSALKSITRSLFLGEKKEQTPMEFEVNCDSSKPSETNQSFSIDDEDGSFLGECGIGLENGILQVWLFDKSDIKTDTAYFYFGEKNRPKDPSNQKIDEKKLTDLAFIGNIRESGEIARTLTLNISILFKNISYEDVIAGEDGKKIRSFSARIIAAKNESVT